jgi:hypothetical protein
MINMKASIVLLITAFALGSVSAQTDVTNALGKGDVTSLSEHLAEKVELSIGDKEELLLKSEVVSRLNAFYSTHPARGFKAMHSGNSKAKESNYTIGELLTDSGNYRVYIYFTQEGGKRMIAELRIEH